jgi:hypothetical protein
VFGLVHRLCPAAFASGSVRGAVAAQQQGVEHHAE